MAALDQPLTAAPAPVKLRRFDDVDTLRQDVYDQAKLSFGQMRPVANLTHRLEISDVDYDGDYAPTKDDEKQALLKGGSLARPLYGTMRLIDQQTNKPVDEQRVVLARVPHVNSRGLFIRNGVVWGLRNQQRLRPGVYTRRQNNGGVESMFNVKPGSGRGFRVNLEPETGLLKMQVGQSTTRLYPIMKAMGYDDDQLKEAWGEELFNKNRREHAGRDVEDLRKVVKKLGRPDLDVQDQDLPQALKDILARAELDEQTTEHTLGEPIKHVGADTLMKATRKILAVARDEQPGDNRDSQAFQSIHSAEDFIRDRLARDQVGGLRKLLWRAAREGTLGKIPHAPLDKNLAALFEGSGLSLSPEQINPFETYDQLQGITRLGEGGISSPQAISRESRGVQSSYLGTIDPVRAPESEKIGLDLRVTDAALKGSDNQMYTMVRDVRTGEVRAVSAPELARSVVTFPGELQTGAKRVPATRGDELTHVLRSQVDYEIVDPLHMHSRSTAMIPFPEATKSKRLLMGARLTQQAMPLQTPEAPLVQTADETGASMHDKMGEVMGAVKSRQPGVVLKVTPTEIIVRQQDGTNKSYELYNNYPMARKTTLNNTAMVKVGDPVNAGQLLAKSNYTDDKGTTALGTNLRTAFMIAEGGTIEDAMVLSESAAKRLTSEAMYKSELDLKGLHSTKKDDYIALYGDRYKPAQLEKLDDDGVVHEGQTVQMGDPLMLAIGQKSKRGVGALMDSPRSRFSDHTQTWEHRAPGVVTDVVKTRGGYKVTVKSYDQLQPGDKLSQRFGGKGIVGEVRPDDQMPHDAQGRPMDILFNALGTISRENPSAVAEALLGKVAEKTGKPYVIKGFKNAGQVADFALNEALKHGIIGRDDQGRIVDTEDLTDPRDGRKLPKIFTGVSYFMKLHHLAETKLSARDAGQYTVDDAPAKGGFGGSKRVAVSDTGALLSAGATEFLRDAKLLRGQRNDDYWRSVRQGDTPVEPTESFANDRFKNLLRAAGVNLREKGTRTQLSPMLDDDVDRLAQHEIEHGRTLNFESMEPEDGGLFDIAKTGGVGGNRFSKIVLPTKIPHPLFVEPIQKLLGLTGKGLENILAGREQLNGQTGPEAVETALKGVNIDREMEAAKLSIVNGRKTHRDAAVKRLNYLAGLKRMDVRPEQLMVSRIPVIPPKYRPVISGDKVDVVHDLNYLYHDLLEAKKNYVDAKDTLGDAGDEYVTLMHATQAISGMRDPVNPKSVEQGVKGVLQSAIGMGDSPKGAAFQYKVVGSAVDQVGRGTITADKSLDMDEVSIPKTMAWEVFKPYVIRRLVQSGLPAANALQEVRDQTPRAMSMLRDEMKERPVVYNRAPALHRFAYSGAYARLRDDDAIGMPYAVLKGLGADYDGDCGRFLLAIRSTASTVDPQRSTMPFPIDCELIQHQGVVAIQDLPIDEASRVVIRDGVVEYDVQTGVEVYAYDCATGGHSWYPVTKLSVHHDLDMRAVTIGRRYSETVTVSSDHALICYDPQLGRCTPTRPDDALGLLVPSVKLLSEPSPAESVLAAGLTHKRVGVKGIVGSTTTYVDIERDIPLTRDTGLFLGLIVGDGWVAVNNLICLSNVDDRVLDAFHRVGETIGLTKQAIQSWDAPSLGGVITQRKRATMGTAWLAKWLRPHVGEGALNKRIPSYCLNGTREHLLGLLDGLISTDGSVSINNSRKQPQLLVTYTTVSPDLVDGIRFIARRLGVRVSVNTTTTTRTGKLVYQMNFSTPDLKPLMEGGELRLTHPDKQAVLERGLSHITTDSPVEASTDLVPYCQLAHPIILKVMRLHCTGDYGGSIDRATAAASAAKKLGAWSRMQALRVTTAYRALDEGARQELLCPSPYSPHEPSPEMLTAMDAYVCLVEDRSIDWKPVTAVEVAPVQTGYDITVPGPLTFATAAGIIVQDSINVHVPSSKAAVDEVKNKLMPSKSLRHPGTFETHYEPVQDYLHGLYLATRPDPTQKPRTFQSAADAKAAYARGEITARTPIRIV